MLFDKDKAEMANEKISEGFAWLEDYIVSCKKWIFATNEFIFGHDKVLMTTGISEEGGQSVVVLHHEAFSKTEELLTLPHVKLIFDNEKGVDSLIRSLEEARRLLKEGK